MSVTGSWRIIEMDLWDLEAIDLLGPGFIEFGPGGTGHFRFIAVEGFMDCRSGRRRGRPCVEFTWEGDDDGEPASGRGWVVRDEDGSLHGHIYFHLGDDSGFRAVPTEDTSRSTTPHPSEPAVTEPAGARRATPSARRPPTKHR